VHCYAFGAVVVAAKECRIPIGVLTVEPYNLLKGNSVMARVIANNFYGDSDFSPAGNGAIMIIVPDAPINLQNDLTVTDRTRIGFTWDEGYSNGGSLVIDYRISYDQAKGIWVELAVNHLPK
jgi:hypothetical protein